MGLGSLIGPFEPKRAPLSIPSLLREGHPKGNGRRRAYGEAPNACTEDGGFQMQGGVGGFPKFRGTLYWGPD